MRTSTILRRLDVGSDVAETDEKLARYFVDTGDFFDIVEDRYDVVLGVKGSGKSAIFRRLADPGVAIRQLSDVDVIPAFNTQGSVIFQKLAHEVSQSIGERDAALIWYAYICALLGNHLVTVYGDDAASIKSTLERFGLLLSTADPASTFDRVLAHAHGIISATSLEAEVKLQAVPVSGAIKATKPVQPSSTHPKRILQEDLELLFSLCDDLLSKMGRRCWVIFDRLDEAFYDASNFERVALRGLLRSKIDLNSYGATVGTKIFLRTDVIDRVTRDEGFVNATHLRQLHLRWDSGQVQSLIAYRVGSDPVTRRQLGLREGDLHTAAGHKRVCRRVFPERIDGLFFLDWILEVTTDASDLPNPRNVIALLQLARRRQLRSDESARKDYQVKRPLITAETWKAAGRDLSEKRLTDTVLAEAPELRRVLEALRGRAYMYSRAQLAVFLDDEPESELFKKTLDRLMYHGLVREEIAGSYEIPRLYRPALGLRQAHPKTRSRGTIGEAHQRRLDRVVTELLAKTHDTGEPQLTTWLTAEERRYVHEEVSSRSEETSSESTEGRADGRKRIRLTPQATSRFSVEDRSGTTSLPADDATELVGDETMAELFAHFDRAVESIRVHGNRWYIAPPLMIHEANILAALVREHSSESSEYIRVVAMIIHGSSERACVFGRDVPGTELAQQDEYCRSVRGRRLLGGMVEDAVAVSRERRARIELRPMADRMTALVLADLVGRDDVEFHIVRQHPVRIAIQAHATGPRHTNTPSR